MALTHYEKLRLNKQARLEEEYGKPLEQIFKDLSTKMAFTPACTLLGLKPKYYKQFKSMFTPNFFSKEAKAKANKLRSEIMSTKGVRYLNCGRRHKDGLTVKEWAKKTGASEFTIRRRISMGREIILDGEQPKPVKTVSTEESKLWNIAFFNKVKRGSKS